MVYNVEILMAVVSGYCNNILKMAFLCVCFVLRWERTGGTDPKFSHDVVRTAVQEWMGFLHPSYLLFFPKL